MDFASLLFLHVGAVGLDIYEHQGEGRDGNRTRLTWGIASGSWVWVPSR